MIPLQFPTRAAIICAFGMALWLIPSLIFLSVGRTVSISVLVIDCRIAIAFIILLIFLTAVSILRWRSEAKLRKQYSQQKRPERQADQTCCSLFSMRNWCCISELEEEIDTPPLSGRDIIRIHSEDRYNAGLTEREVEHSPLLREPITTRPQDTVTVV